LLQINGGQQDNRWFANTVLKQSPAYGTFCQVVETQHGEMVALRVNCGLHVADIDRHCLVVESIRD